MIDLYTWSSPNGLKVLIMLEETGLDIAEFLNISRWLQAIGVRPAVQRAIEVL